MKITFLGDIALNNNYIELYRTNINPFIGVENILKSNDYVIGNLECMLEGEQGENELKKPRLTTKRETLNYLKYMHLNVACLAHNHVYDHLEDGFRKTISFLKQNEIMYLGAGLTKGEVSRPIILEKDGLKIGILNYVTRDTNPNLPQNAGVLLNTFEIEKCKNDINIIKSEVNHVVLSLHWGGRVEGGLYPDWDQPKLARHLIDVGADIIIGHHSHTFQPYEIYKGKYIFYSLGNFCFSDYYFDGQFYPLSKRRNLTGLIHVNFYKTGYYINNYFYRNKGDHFQEKKNYPIKFHNWIYKLLIKKKPFWNIYFFYLKNILPAIQIGRAHV